MLLNTSIFSQSVSECEITAAWQSYLGSFAI